MKNYHFPPATAGIFKVVENYFNAHENFQFSPPACAGIEGAENFKDVSFQFKKHSHHGCSKNYMKKS
jgi:hypothetical protein